ncbi:hypothetical protein HAX54_024782 [Datura stramonium]|uniref:Uncharacterized protein n=1 Tax=Datura stramonium TaxID=4076 RepID=A0ABS8V1B2_DATST|nr:hypothetical protein [Datura stramonium]
MDMSLIAAKKSKYGKNGVDEMSMIEVGIAQAYMCYGLHDARAKMEHGEARSDRHFSAMPSVRHCHVQRANYCNRSSTRNKNYKTQFQSKKEQQWLNLLL